MCHPTAVVGMSGQCCGSGLIGVWISNGGVIVKVVPGDALISAICDIIGHSMVNFHVLAEALLIGAQDLTTHMQAREGSCSRGVADPADPAT